MSKKIVRSLTVRNLALPPETNKDTRLIPSSKILGTIIGVCRSVEFLPSKFDDSLMQPRFSGDFRAINSDNGEITESATAYLPAIFGNVLAAALKPDENGEIVPVEFAFDVHVKPSSQNASGYTYEAEARLEASEAKSPLDLLAARLEKPSTEKPALPHNPENTEPQHTSEKPPVKNIDKNTSKK